MSGKMPDRKPEAPKPAQPSPAQANPAQANPAQANPEDDGLYRAIMMVLVGSVLLGAVLTLSGESLFGSRPLSTVGLGMAVLAGIAYWGLRIKARMAARRATEASDRDRQGPRRE